MVTKTVFSGKAFASIQIDTPIKVIAINQNSFGVVAYENAAAVEEINIPIPAASIKITKVEKVEGEIPLTEASLVVSGGRGLKKQKLQLKKQIKEQIDLQWVMH